MGVVVITLNTIRYAAIWGQKRDKALLGVAFYSVKDSN